MVLAVIQGVGEAFGLYAASGADLFSGPLIGGFLALRLAYVTVMEQGGVAGAGEFPLLPVRLDTWFTRVGDAGSGGATFSHATYPLVTRSGWKCQGHRFVPAATTHTAAVARSGTSDQDVWA